jgi:hypothetical protein
MMMCQNTCQNSNWIEKTCKIHIKPQTKEAKLMYSIFGPNLRQEMQEPLKSIA